MKRPIPYQPRYQPDNCPHCEYDRRFPETAEGGWVYPGNNAPLAPCPLCNPYGTYRPRMYRRQLSGSK